MNACSVKNGDEELKLWGYHLSPGSLLESASIKLALSNKTLNSLHDGNAGGKELLVQCSKSSDEESGYSSNVIEASIVEVQLVSGDALLESGGDRYSYWSC